eukprot:TRINITY_DN30496_c0_g1_i1.p1 TRINITY_DN30496_c0_g1~~TRINITY_DN30496_c0_g1_i1.p1  ORF type:complete len:416 (-),score=54.75 TRINITY_DN30496_c0_g1_i1:450-1697(-)
MDEQNARLLQQREASVQRFISVTNAGREDAVGIMRRYAFDVEEAVEAFLGGERCPVSAAEAAPPGASDAEATEEPPPREEPPRRPASQVDRILDSADKVDRGRSQESALFAGAGNSLSASGPQQRSTGPEPEALEVHITFYGNGFTVVEGAEANAGRGASSGSTGSASSNRRTGMATINDFGGPRSNQDEFTGTATLRSFDDAAGQAFMRDVENSRVPQELRRIDPTSRRPIPVSIVLQDRRPKNYRHVPDTSFKAFAGSSGQALGSSNTNYTALSDGVPQTSGFLTLFRMLRTCPRRFLGIGPAPPQRPIFRPNDPFTKLQIRLSSGERIQVTLNNDAPISDVFQAVECEMYEQWQSTGGEESGAWVCPAFDLFAGYPPQPLSADRAVSLERHTPSLIGAAVTQRMRQSHAANA